MTVQTDPASFFDNSFDALRHRTGLIPEVKFFAVSRSLAAQQRAEQRLGGASIGATFRCRPFFVSSAGESDTVGPSDRLHFLLVRFLYASKENEHNTKRILIFYK